MKSLKILLHTTALVWCLLNYGEATKFSFTPQWKVNQRQHRCKTLTDDQLKKVISMSNITHLEHRFLDPFLRVRWVDTPAHREVQKHIKDTMAKYGWLVEEDSFTDYTPLGRKRFTNIVATQNITATRRLILACHYDSMYITEFEYIGAVDAAVSCAMILDVAHHLNTSLWMPDKEDDISLQLIFFDGNEPFSTRARTDCLYGSRHLSSKWSVSHCSVGKNDWANQLETIDLIIVPTGIGTRFAEFHSWLNNTEDLFKRFQKIEMRLMKLGLLKDVDQSDAPYNYYFTNSVGYQPGSISDDHMSFYHKGVPAIHLINFPLPSVQHRAGDNKDALEFTVIDDVNNILRVFVCEYLHISP